MRFEDIDFAAMYQEQKARTTFQPKSAADWDKKAANMNQKVFDSIYNKQFLRLVDTRDAKSVLDVGCGVGNLSLLLAKNVEHVQCLDFSTQMLHHLRQNAAKQKIDNITALQRSWYDCWDDIAPADIVIASRSMEVRDMATALRKLHEKAKKRVYISYKVGGSFLPKEVLALLDKPVTPKPDYIYILNILYNMGIHASVQFIQSENKGRGFDSKEAFLQSVQWSVGNLSKAEEKRLSSWYNSKPRGNDPVYWAVISWAKQQE